MLNRAYRYIDDEDVFRLRGSVLAKATFQKMLRMIIKTKPGRELICRVGAECEKRGQPVILAMMHPQKGELGHCEPSLIIKIANPNQKDFSKAKIERATFQQTMTLVHELGHVLQFLKREDRINASLPLKDRFYAQVWMEAEADLWLRDVETELSQIYTGLSKNMNLLKTRFKSRSDFVRSFFVKGRNYDWMKSGVEVIISELMNAKQVILPNMASHLYFPKLMNQRFARMRLPLKYNEIPFDKCFWVEKLPEGVSMIRTETKYALVAPNGSLLSVCDQETSPVTIKSFGEPYLKHLLRAGKIMPISSRRATKLKECDYLTEEPFKLTTRQLNVLAQPLDRFGGRLP